MKKNAKNALKKQTTSKKQKLIGVTHYIDPKTGELVPMQVTKVEYRDFNFHKVWLQNLIVSLDDVTNKKMELAFWIIDNLNKENQLVMTYRTIAKKSGISEGTVKATMKALQTGSIPFLKKINSGAYQVNPEILWKGTHSSRMGIVFDYSTNKPEEEEFEEEFEEDYNEETVENKDNETDTD